MDILTYHRILGYPDILCRIHVNLDILQDSWISKYTNRIHGYPDISGYMDI